MRYGKILGDAWRALWRAPGMWGVIVVGYASVAVILGAVTVGIAASGLAAYLNDALNPSVGAIFAALAVLLVAAIMSALTYWVFHGGLVYLSNEALEGRRAPFTAGWSAGFRRLGSLVGFEIVLGLITGTLYAVGTSILIFAFGGTMALAGLNEGDAWAGGTGIVGICCGYAVFLAVLFLVATLVTGFEAVGARSVVIGSRGAFAALSEAWSVLTKRFKHLFVMGVIMLGIQWAYGFLTSIVLTPLQFFFMPDFLTNLGTVPPDPETIISSFGRFYGIYGTASVLLMIPITVFGYLAWTGFFRQVVGLDAPPVEPVWTEPAAYGTHPAPPATPAQHPATPDAIPPVPAPSEVVSPTLAPPEATLPAPPEASGWRVPPPPEPPGRPSATADTPQEE